MKNAWREILLALLVPATLWLGASVVDLKSQAAVEQERWELIKRELDENKRDHAAILAKLDHLIEENKNVRP